MNIVMNRVKSGLAAMLACVAVAGCSLENQAVTISPSLTYKAEKIGREQPIHLTVIDKRSSRLIGYRKDETKDRADITAANDVRTVVYNTVKQVLLENGFLIASGADSSVGSYSVEIDTLSYAASGAYLAPSVETRMLLKGTAARGGAKRSNNYEISRSGREAKPLTAERNAKMINDIVSQTLNMLAEDRQMLEFLANAPAQAR